MWVDGFAWTASHFWAGPVYHRRQMLATASSLGYTYAHVFHSHQLPKHGCRHGRGKFYPPRCSSGKGSMQPGLGVRSGVVAWRGRDVPCRKSGGVYGGASDWILRFACPIPFSRSRGRFVQAIVGLDSRRLHQNSPTLFPPSVDLVLKSMSTITVPRSGFARINGTNACTALLCFFRSLLSIHSP